MSYPCRFDSCCTTTVGLLDRYRSSSDVPCISVGELIEMFVRDSFHSFGLNAIHEGSYYRNDGRHKERSSNGEIQPPVFSNALNSNIAVSGLLLCLEGVTSPGGDRRSSEKADMHLLNLCSASDPYSWLLLVLQDRGLVAVAPIIGKSRPSLENVGATGFKILTIETGCLSTSIVLIHRLITTTK